MSLVTPEALERSVANLAEMMRRLVVDVEQLKADRDELRAQYRAHGHTVSATANSSGSTTATAGDGSASISVTTTVTATTSTPV